MSYDFLFGGEQLALLYLDLTLAARPFATAKGMDINPAIGCDIKQVLTFRNSYLDIVG